MFRPSPLKPLLQQFEEHLKTLGFLPHQTLKSEPVRRLPLCVLAE